MKKESESKSKSKSKSKSESEILNFEVDIRNLVSDLLRLDLKTHTEGNGLLHMAVQMEIEFFNWKVASVTRFLLTAGADANVVNDEGSSPLMLAVLMSQAAKAAKSEKNYEFYQNIVKILLDGKAHIDQVMATGQTLCERIGWREFLNVTGLTNPYINLKCLAARVVQRYQISYVGQVPPQVERFIKLH